MIPAEIISKKRDGLPLDEVEIKNFIHGYLSGDITKAQMSALLMAIYFKSMNKDETLCLTEIMVNSGTKLDFHNSKSYVADKHSTGGIGDKISLILAPLMAASGIKTPMIAGRALGFTGGTIDKLKAIPGFNTSPTISVAASSKKGSISGLSLKIFVHTSLSLIFNEDVLPSIFS